MKKVISAVLIFTMLVSLLTGCARKNTTEEDPSKDPGNETTDAGDNSQSTGGDVQTGDKISDKTGGSTDKTNDKTGSSGDSTTQKPGTTKPTGGNSATNTPKPGTPGPGTSKADDIDPNEVEHFESDGEIDTKYEGKDNGLPYIEKAATTVSDFTVTKDNYNEKDLTLPVINIKTSTGKDITSKTEYLSSTLSVTNTTMNNSIKSTTVDVRGRGNSTWSEFEKKAYKLKFTVDTDMFGMGSAKKWVLLSNALDETMLRNYLAFTLGKSLGLEYTTDVQFVNVFINNQYKGVYLLCEQVQEHTARVNINSSKTGQVDTGYLLEGINNLAAVEYKTFRLDAVDGQSLGKNSQFNFIVKSPENNECTDKQLQYIKDYVKNANEAIFKADWAKIKQYVDVDSFVNMFLLDEILLSQDMGYSFYMYKKAGGKLFMGPAWDFDQSCGVSSHGGSGYKGWYAGSELQWFTKLIEIPEFRALVANRYKEKKFAIHSMLDLIDNTVNKNSYDFAMSNYIFNTFGSTTRWRTMYEIARLKTYKEHIIYLKTWLTNRFIWMEDQLKV